MRIKPLPEHKLASQIAKDHPELYMSANFVRYWAGNNGVRKHSDVYMFTKEDEEKLLHQRKLRPANTEKFLFLI